MKYLGMVKCSIFMAFQRKNLVVRENGTGLGLSVVQGIVNTHKGNILVESDINKGTKFIICLPHTEVCQEKQININLKDKYRKKVEKSYLLKINNHF